ncbi:MAG: BT_3928 family protein [Bacteroidales bacterium]
MKRIVIVSRYLIALVFIFSGFVKGVDPLGSAYKFHDYFVAFHLDFLEPLSLLFSFLLGAAELLIGLLLLFGVRLKIAAWGAFLFMLLFTPLTLFLAIFNPVSDCGCFGDAVHLSNWQTFYKNIVFFAASIVLLVYRGNLECTFAKWKEYFLLVLLIIVAFAPAIHGYQHLPSIDFRPYHVGVNIYNDMTVPEGAPSDEYSTKFSYRKDGIIKEFDESNYPWDDSTWTFVDAKSILVKEGYTAPIHNFTLNTLEGEDITEKFVTASGYSFLVVSSRLDKADVNAFKKLTDLYYKANEKGYGFICATATSLDAIRQFTSENAIPFQFVTADEVTLKTIVRSNPGLLLLYNGTIIGKWHWRDFPDVNYVNSDMYSMQLSEMASVANKRLSIALGAFLLLLLIIVKFWK